MCVNTIFKTGKNIAMYIDNINNKKFIDNRCKIQKNLEIDNTGIADNSTDLTAARNEYNILTEYAIQTALTSAAYPYHMAEKI